MINNNLDIENIIGEMDSHPLFIGVEQENINSFLENATVKKYEKNNIIFVQEDKADFFYILLSGCVKLFRETLEGEEAIIDILSKGGLIGETSIFDDGLHSCNCQAIEPSKLLCISTSTLNEKIDTSNKLARNLLKVMSKKQESQSKEIEHLTVQDSSQRIGCFILRLCAGSEGEAKIDLPYDKSLIATKLGMKPETFSRSLNRLKKNTNIEIKKSAVIVPDIEALAQYCCNHCSGTYPCKDL